VILSEPPPENSLVSGFQSAQQIEQIRQVAGVVVWAKADKGLQHLE
jgi:hypothetical protein